MVNVQVGNIAWLVADADPVVGRGAGGSGPHRASDLGTLYLHFYGVNANSIPWGFASVLYKRVLIARESKTRAYLQFEESGGVLEHNVPDVLGNDERVHGYARHKVQENMVSVRPASKLVAVGNLELVIKIAVFEQRIMSNACLSLWRKYFSTC